MQKHLETLLRNAAECKLVSDLATDKEKQELFARLAEHHRGLAGEVQRAINQQSSQEKMRKAEQTERTAAMEEWISSPGLPPPE